MGKRAKIIYQHFGRILLYIVILSLVINTTMAMKTKVVITGGASEEYEKDVGEALTDLVNAFGSQDFELIKKHTTPQSFEDIKSIIEETECYTVNALYERRLIKVTLGKYEVRDIKVKVNMKKTRGNPFQYLVFTLNSQSVVEEVRFAIERHQYQEVLDEGKKLQDFTRRQKILHFIEIFRTAYNRKDLEYLKKVYSEDALIIV